MTIEAIDRTVALLEQLAKHPKGVGLIKLAENVGLAASTAHRYLSSLQHHKLVEQDESKLYRLTQRLYLLGLAAGEGFSLETHAQGTLQRLAQASQETSCLMVRDGRHAVCIGQVDSEHQLKIAARVGSRQDLRVGATSRILLAYAPEEIQNEILQQGIVPKYTPNTVTDPAEIRQILHRIRLDGYYISRAEIDKGVLAVAAPVMDRRGEVIAALVVAAPESRVNTQETLESIVRLVTAEANELSLSLGFSGIRPSSIKRSFA